MIWWDGNAMCPIPNSYQPSVFKFLTRNTLPNSASNFWLFKIYPEIHIQRYCEYRSEERKHQNLWGSASGLAPASASLLTSLLNTCKSFRETSEPERSGLWVSISTSLDQPSHACTDHDGQHLGVRSLDLRRKCSPPREERESAWRRKIVGWSLVSGSRVSGTELF